MQGCRALPKSHDGSGTCLLGKGFVTRDDDFIVPLVPNCPDKSITVELFSYKLSF
jgi:hypothetical protein